MDLVERGEQLTLLGGMAKRSFGGQGQTALITGPVASGKTTLLHAVGEQLERDGALLLTAACAATEQSLEGGVIGQLLRDAPLRPQVAEHVACLLAELGEAGRANDEEGEVDAVPAAPRPELLHQYNALCLRLLELGADRPVVVAVDDVQRADAASQTLLLQLVRRLRSSRILAVLTDGREPHVSRSSLQSEFHRLPQLRRLRVLPLSPAGVKELVARRFGHGHDSSEVDRLAPQVFAATGGNPLLVTSLLDDLRTLRDAEGVAAAVAPDSMYGPALLHCLHRGGAEVVSVARALAVLDDTASPEQLTRLLDIEAGVVERILRTMNASGLTADGTLRHAAARVAIRDDTPRHLRTTLHERAAEVLREAGSPAATVGRHLHAAGSPPPQWAFQVLLEAAEHALAADEGEEVAAAYLRLALRTSPPLPSNMAIARSRLAEIGWRANPAAADHHATALASAARSGQLPHQEAVLVVRQLLWHGRTDEGASVWERVRSGSAAGADLSLDVRAFEHWLRYAYPPLIGQLRDSDRTTHGGGPAAVVPLLDPWLQATGLLAELSSRGDTARAAGHADQVLRDLLLGRRTGWAEEAMLASLLALVRAERLDAARSWSARLLTAIEGRGACTWTAILMAAQSEVALAQGDLVLARDRARAAVSEVPPKGWGVTVGLPLSGLVLANTHLGDYDAAAALLSQPVPDSMFQSRYGLHYLYARGQYRLATRHHHAALADFLSCGELMRAWGLDIGGMPPWRAAAAESWLRLGNRDQASRLVSEQMSRSHNSARHRALALRLLAATGPANRRPPLLTESLELAENCGDLFEQARVLGELSNAYHRLGHDRRARMVHRRALYLAKVCQADPLYREMLSVNQELGEVEVSTGDEDGTVLTGSERRVASLAAIGYTNREIAGKLFITPSTVEQHLTRVYRKLNIKHRGELPTDLVREPSSGRKRSRAWPGSVDASAAR